MTERAQALAAQLIRNFHDAELTSFKREPLYEARSVRLARGTAAQKLGASYDIVEPGKTTCPYHLHYAQEEMFIVLEGHGTLRVAGEMLPIKAGDVIFIPAGPEYPHHIINTSDAPIKYLSISTMEQPEICVYPDSNKFMAEHGPDKSTRPFEAIRKVGEGDLDYWQDEP
ncbi:cupin domain-containing protein [Roseateles sp. So40a]|uniref:cupin domain-containing protein n=1 Tax=Roseateles sp. So40a TaxID=3400226 RepID=UPI003A8BAD27